jgi:hypothetical protein
MRIPNQGGAAEMIAVDPNLISRIVATATGGTVTRITDAAGTAMPVRISFAIPWASRMCTITTDASSRT